MPISVPPRHILLDYDGVVGPDYYDLRGEPRDVETYKRLSIYGVDLASLNVRGQLIVDPDVVTRINALGRIPGVTVYWFSAAGFVAPRYLGPALGFDEFAFSPFASDATNQEAAPGSGWKSRGWWKYRAVAEHLKQTIDEGTQILWADDRIYGDVQHFLRDEDGADQRLSWVRPDFRLGLSSDDLDVMEEWATTGGRVRRDVDKVREAEYRELNPEAYADEFSSLDQYNLDDWDGDE